MATTVLIPRILQQYCRGKAELRLRASTVQSALLEIESDYPSLYACLCDETGAVRQHLNLFLNDKLISSEEYIDMRLKPDDVVSVFQAVSGG